MDRFNCRSPFIVEVDGDIDQVGTKIFLEVYSQDGVALIVAKEIEKKMFSPTNRVNYYNISPFIFDALNTLDTNYFGCIVYVTKFWFDGTTYTQLETSTYVSTNGYSDYLNPNDIEDKEFIALSKEVTYDINYTRGLDFTTLDFIFDFTTFGGDYECVISDGIFSDTETIANNGSYLFKRLVLTNSSIHYDVKNYFQVFKIPLGVNPEIEKVFQIRLVNLCEPKYTPIKLDYVNRFGGLQSMTFFKNSTQNIEAKGSEYNTNTFTTYPIYEASLGQKRVFNKNGSKSIKCNSGWVNESENENVKDILLSENLLLTYTEEGATVTKAVTLKSSSQLLKTGLNEKVINYELEFEVASQLINNVV